MNQGSIIIFTLVNIILLTFAPELEPANLRLSWFMVVATGSGCDFHYGYNNDTDWQLAMVNKNTVNNNRNHVQLL